MTWMDLFRTEVGTLYAYEENAAPFLQKLQARAFRAPTHELLMQLTEAIVPRQGRLEVICAFERVETSDDPPLVLVGLIAEADRLLSEREPSEVLDAEILVLALKALRFRTTGYEAAFLLAKSLGIDSVANLLVPIWIEAHKADDRISGVLASLVEGSDKSWDESLRRSQIE